MKTGLLLFAIGLSFGMMILITCISGCAVRQPLIAVKSARFSSIPAYSGPSRPEPLIAGPLYDVMLGYDADPVSGPILRLLETGISASPDLGPTNWQVIWFEPYPAPIHARTHVTVTLSNRPPEFYRAFWRWKQ